MSVQTFDVAPHGNDSWSGTVRKPFATLERARDAVRALKAAGGLPAGGVQIRVGGGDYVRERTLELTAADSGTVEAPVVWLAARRQRPRLLGGRVIAELAPVTDEAVLARLPAAARSHVRQADLRALGIVDFGQLRPRGFGRSGRPAHLELFFGGHPMTVARWPAEGFVQIASIPAQGSGKDEHGGTQGRLEEGFHYEGDRPAQWQSLRNVWVHGYWAWDWANSYEEVDHIDPATRRIWTKLPFGQYGFRAGQRYYFLNILEELAVPGQYYVDVDRGLLYFWPPAPLSGQELLASVLEPPLLSLTDVAHVTIRGLTFECTRGHGMTVHGGEHVTVRGCCFRNIGDSAVIIQGGTHHLVSGCDLSETGECGVSISGGDRATLTPCHHRIHNNHFWHFSRWARCYAPAVLLHWVGIRVSHNLMNDAPHTAILYHGNENVIEYNEIHHVTLETGDAGAIYTGRDYTARGNVTRYNYIHHTGGVGMGTMGMYYDDCVSGQSLIGNVFQHCTRAAMMGGGRELKVLNNVFVDCEPAIYLDARGLSPAPVWHNMVYETMRKSLEAARYHEPPYSERYPELLQLDQYYARTDGIPPGNNVVERNLCVGGRWADIVWFATPEHARIRRNLLDRDPLFVDPANDDFRLRPESPAWELGFRPLPLDRIGLVKDADRKYRPRLRARLEFLPGAAPAAPALRLHLINDGDGALAGNVQLRIDPPHAARCRGTDTCGFALPPGATTTADFPLDVRLPNFTVETFTNEPYLRPARLRCRPGPWAVPQLGPVADAAQVSAALAGAKVQRVFWEDACLAEIRVGLAGEFLAVHATVYDRQPARAADWWQASCFELFGSQQREGQVGQVVLLPPAADAPAEALRYRLTKREGPSQSTWQTRSVSDGYELCALVPLAELGLDAAATAFLLEVSVGVAVAPDGGHRYTTLFGSRSAYQNPACFGQVTVVPGR